MVDILSMEEEKNSVSHQILLVFHITEKKKMELVCNKPVIKFMTKNICCV